MTSDSIFRREQNEPVIYVIHKQYYDIKGMPVDQMLPYFFKSRKQANRYLASYLGAVCSHGEFVSFRPEYEVGDIRRRVTYKIQHLSGMHEYTLNKKTGRHSNVSWMKINKFTA